MNHALDLHHQAQSVRAAYGVVSALLMPGLVLYLRNDDALAGAEATQKALMQEAHDRLEAEVAQRTAPLTDLTRHLLTWA